MSPTDRKGGAPGYITPAAILALAALAAAGSRGAVAQDPGTEAGLKATIERLGNFAYAGDPVMVRLAVFNTSETPYDNAGRLDLLGKVTVVNLDQGRLLAARERAERDPRQEPAVIPAGGFFGMITDLATLVEGLDSPGRYSARLSLDGSKTVDVPLAVIPRFDPGTAYRATMETDYGKMSFDLLGKEAPGHVRNFFDLANQGYYDGKLFHAIVKGLEIHGGDATGDASSSPGYSLDPEIAPGLTHARGTLSMFRPGTLDHGSFFVISLGENTRRDGAHSIFGVLASGEETLAALENLPTYGTRERNPFRPLSKVTIRSLRVEPAPEGSSATASSGTVTAPEGQP